ncbi:3'(2'),5'-bisphosphate nucleotidase CysQ [Rhodoplanes sp. Z2-YC6860]|uniref:3'(2'),5'-bisphosphate nucleotidase CysQ n=1 Tax=Rhodoplanes sp. Z2-YC6860 TaxID=674703 RepID=UPI00078EA128|nr:3'(2'),5'-bisphosphate nucleotidase CysQ [Rhodoplanes sp. Z2-YC6860]AMN43600.1 3'(2'),5'-bisphosphate nucleotidase [Rhodoplanes sp. Z2-YC6860]
MVDYNQLALAFGAIAVEAGQLIMKARDKGCPARRKADGSPVTEADLVADQFIRDRLPDIACGALVITEEAFDLHEVDPLPDRFILVDPLDGTREFAAGRDEFTVNIALIEAARPVAGVIYAPATSQLYIAGNEAYHAEVKLGEAIPKLEAMRRLSTAPVPHDGLRAVASRSHLDSTTKQWLDERAIKQFCSAGSSLKFCTLADGKADVYPRFSPTMEWDTAAGQAILTVAGGCVLALDGTPLCYGKTADKFRNSGFIAWGRAPSL